MHDDPIPFLQDIARQTQLLACLHWLSDFQVLACVPIAQSVAFQDVADLAGVPVAQLARVVRMTATAGFLCESHPNHVAHSHLSAQFVQKPSLLDTVMFISENSVPAALCMSQATRLHGNTPQALHSPWNLALQSSTPFTAACKHEAKLQRQFAAFQRLWASSIEDSVTHALSSLEWPGIGKATVVEVGPQSTATAVALAERAPRLDFIVQMREDTGRSIRRALTNGDGKSSDTGPNITIQQRALGAPQSITDAAVYILHLPTTSLATPSSSMPAQIIAELQAHFHLLRQNSSAMLILVARLMAADASKADAEVESISRQQDLLLLQMANDEPLQMPQLMELVNNVRDASGRLTVVNKLPSRHHLATVFEVKIREESDQAEN